MSKVSNSIAELWGGGMKTLVDKFTRIKFDSADFGVVMSLSDDKIVMELRPLTAYGKFALAQINEAHTTDELSKG